MLKKISAGACVLFHILLISADAGFERPVLPRESRAIYKFDDGPARNDASSVSLSSRSTLPPADGFSLSIGYRDEALRTSNEGFSHQEKAQELLKKISKGLARMDLSGMEISVSRIYAITNEIILNVRLEDPSAVEWARMKLIKAISDAPGVLFTGEPQRIKAD